MKNTGNAQQWACDVVTNDFDQEFIDQLRILTDNDILLVPRRLKGITSGENGCCYWNANICAQTWGGKVIYGWCIDFVDDPTNSGAVLYGHACWLTPEGKLVDVTHHPESSADFFVPYTDQLILNAKVTESVCDLYYPKSKEELECFLDLSASLHASHDAEYSGYYQGIGISHERYLGKIVYCDALPSDFVFKVMNGMNATHQQQIHHMFSPCVKAVDQGAPKKRIHDPNLTFADMRKRFSSEGAPICSLYIGYDVTAELKGDDMVWDGGIVNNPSLANVSLKTGKAIKDIAPLQEIVDKHSLPTQKKRLNKVVTTSEKYNLSPQEVVMLSNPFLFPHPYLMNKAGWESIPRIKTADLIVD